MRTTYSNETEETPSAETGLASEPLSDTSIITSARTLQKVLRNIDAKTALIQRVGLSSHNQHMIRNEDLSIALEWEQPVLIFDADPDEDVVRDVSSPEYNLATHAWQRGDRVVARGAAVSSSGYDYHSGADAVASTIQDFMGQLEALAERATSRYHFTRPVISTSFVVNEVSFEFKAQISSLFFGLRSA